MVIVLSPLYTYYITINTWYQGIVALFKIDGLKICHSGEIDHSLSDEQIKELGRVDVLSLCVGLLAPVGERRFIPDKPGPNNFFWSDYIIDADVANQLYDQIKPKILIPIHYGNEKCSFKLVNVEEFLKGKKNVVRADSSEVEISPDKLSAETQIISIQPAQ